MPDLAARMLRRRVVAEKVVVARLAGPASPRSGCLRCATLKELMARIGPPEYPGSDDLSTREPCPR